MRPSPVPRGRVVTAVALAIAAALPATPALAADPSIPRPPAEPPAADFVPLEGSGPVPPMDYVATGERGIAAGFAIYEWTRQGPVADVEVTFVDAYEGWRYRTTTDAAGRYRMLIPDGSYDVVARDPQAPDRLVRLGGAPYDLRGAGVWGAERGGLVGLSLIERPRHSCLTKFDRVVEGREGWAPGADPTTSYCPYLTPVPNTPEALAAWLNWVPDVTHWATGAAPSTAPPAKTPWTATPPATTALTVTPTRSVVAAASGLVAFRVRCVNAGGCSGRARLTARDRRGRTRIIASRRYRAADGRGRLRLRLTRTGRALLRGRASGAVRARLTWTPDGAGTPALARTVTLRRIR
ncbi:carboxypeptidase-like regulatory domain-containing protein [Patulibacter defluvii]|uniref:carboxypeptidase-like regulatory domain-containing protein n=1 Tax=Patulibacter defluvii TaxID=3095358 RepID=UPI002A760C4F|nr:carboxypeptidase-like regulatory domain-containing protein [Patulibacter sp. DM4]